MFSIFLAKKKLNKNKKIDKFVEKIYFLDFFYFKYIYKKGGQKLGLSNYVHVFSKPQQFSHCAYKILLKLCRLSCMHN